MNYQNLIHSPILSPEISKLVEKCARNNAPVFIQGEQGTGKELIAKVIHHTGDWKPSLFYRVDCRLLKEGGLFAYLHPLLEKIHFGMTPATFYLDEVGHLGPLDQLKLLELIEDGQVQNGMERRTVKNIRFISSSSENLEEKVTQGIFSRDLYCRLKTVAIHVPALRNRLREIGAIAQYLLEENIQQLKLRRLTISDHVLRLLEGYGWPGNLKELEQVIIRSAILAEGDKIMEKDLSIEASSEKNSFFSFVEKAESKQATPPKQEPFPHSSNGPKLPDASLFFLELVHRIKNPLVSIKTFTQLLRDKFNDKEFRDYFYRVVTEDIEKIDSVLNGLLNYIKINHPIEKRDTIHSVLDDVLKRYKPQIEDKKIRLFKKYEKDLPETILHEEQLRYILNSLMQYAIPSIPVNGSIGFLTKSLGNGGFPEGAEKKAASLKGRKYVEILMVFTGYKKSIEPLEPLLGMPSLPEKDLADLEIRLLKEMIERNRGIMKYEVNERKLRTIISLRFPVERRKVITYQTIGS